MSRMRQDFELLVHISSYVRFLLILGVLLVNLTSIVKLIICPRSDWISAFCVHRLATCFILISNLAYLTTWIPYLIWSTFNGLWPFLSSREYCIIQNSVTNHVTTLLLTILTTLKLYDIFPGPKARLLSLTLILCWIIPQGLHATLIDLISPEKSSHPFSDRLLYTPNHLTVNGASHSNHIGFMLCITRLASPVVAQLSWHYLILVIPLTAIIFLSSVAEALKQNQSKSYPYCYCPRDFPVLLSLYFNLMWLIILRPLIILQTLVMAKEGDKQLNESPNYLDFGTHLVLIFSSLLVPFSGYGGFRSKAPAIRQLNDKLHDSIDHPHHPNSINGSTCDLDSIGSQLN